MACAIHKNRSGVLLPHRMIAEGIAWRASVEFIERHRCSPLALNGPMVPRLTDDATASLERMPQHVFLADLIDLRLQVGHCLLLGSTAADQAGMMRVVD